MPMPLIKSCREVTRLVLQGEDRNLSWHERLTVRMHMAICKTCPDFERQVVLIRQALGRWKTYADNGGADEVR